MDPLKFAPHLFVHISGLFCLVDNSDQSKVRLAHLVQTRAVKTHGDSIIVRATAGVHPCSLGQRVGVKLACSCSVVASKRAGNHTNSFALSYIRIARHGESATIMMMVWYSDVAAAMRTVRWPRRE